MLVMFSYFFFTYFFFTSHAQNVISLSFTIRLSIFRDMTESINMKEQWLMTLEVKKQE